MSLFEFKRPLLIRPLTISFGTPRLTIAFRMQPLGPCATVIFTAREPEDRTQFADIWRKPRDERWTIPNPRTSEWEDARSPGP